jgi:general secretion pathway protein C
MNNDFDPKRLWWLVWVLSAILIVKITWVIVEWWAPLPLSGMNHKGSTVQHALHYRYRLASNIKVKAPAKRSSASTTSTSKSSLALYRLVAIYSRSDYAVVTLVRGSKSFMLSSGINGGEVEGFHLKDANATTARFQKGETITTLKLFEKKVPATAVSTAIKPIEPKPEENKAKADTATKGNNATIVNREDGTKMIDRSLIREYTQNPDKIWKNIGLYEVKHEGKLEGFKVRFVRKGSPFEKLGLRRGDIIKSINGEPIVDYATPMRMLKSADAIDDLSLMVERNHEEQELKYEVK